MLFSPCLYIYFILPLTHFKTTKTPTVWPINVVGGRGRRADPVLQTLAAWGETGEPHRLWAGFRSWGRGIESSVGFGVEAMELENLGY